MHLGTNRKEDRASEKLQVIIEGLRGRGYAFVKVSTLLEDVEKIRPYLDDYSLAMNGDARR